MWKRRPEVYATQDEKLKIITQRFDISHAGQSQNSVFSLLDWI